MLFLRSAPFHAAMRTPLQLHHPYMKLLLLLPAGSTPPSASSSRPLKVYSRSFLILGIFILP